MLNLTPQLILILIAATTVVSSAIILFVNTKTIKRDYKKGYFRAIFIQLLGLVVWLSILANVLVPGSSEVTGNHPLINLIIYIVSVLLGIFLIINASREIKVQKIIDDLIHKLQEDNDRLKRLDEQKTEFVSLASHQLRGPLSIIQGYSSMISDGDYGKIPPNLSDPFEKILQSGTALGFLINDYLNVSRIEKGEMEYIIEDVNITKLTKDLVNEFKIIAKKSKLKLEFKCKSEKDYFIRADRNKIRQIISNLIDNAIKYTKEGSVTVSCDRKNNDVLISIKDTGVGLKEQDMKEIFDKFKRAKNAITMNVSGTGLGLYVAKVMTKAQDGEIWAESAGPEKGTTFNIKFPLIK
jgi:signal transduction histidine kinase